MKHLLVHHQVSDFERWKPGYDDHKSAREEAGLKDSSLWRGLDDPHDVVLLFEVRDEAKARELMSSPELKSKMQEVGVIGQPTITFLTDGD